MHDVSYIEVPFSPNLNDYLVVLHKPASMTAKEINVSATRSMILCLYQKKRKLFYYAPSMVSDKQQPKLRRQLVLSTGSFCHHDPVPPEHLNSS